MGRIFFFDLNKINSKIDSMKVMKEVPLIVSNEDIDAWNSDVLYPKTFQISDRHTDVTTYDLSD